MNSIVFGALLGLLSQAQAEAQQDVPAMSLLQTGTLIQRGFHASDFFEYEDAAARSEARQSLFQNSPVALFDVGTNSVPLPRHKSMSLAAVGGTTAEASTTQLEDMDPDSQPNKAMLLEVTDTGPQPHKLDAPPASEAVADPPLSSSVEVMDTGSQSNKPDAHPASEAVAEPPSSYFSLTETAAAEPLRAEPPLSLSFSRETAAFADQQLPLTSVALSADALTAAASAGQQLPVTSVALSADAPLHPAAAVAPAEAPLAPVAASAAADADIASGLDAANLDGLDFLDEEGPGVPAQFLQEQAEPEVFGKDGTEESMDIRRDVVKTMKRLEEEKKLLAELNKRHAA